MKHRVVVTASIVAMLSSVVYAQQAVTLESLRGYLDKMGLRYVAHPKNADALVVPRSENKNAERLDLYVEIRRDNSLVLTVYPKFRGRYFNLDRVTDREKLFQKLLESNQRAFATFFVDPQGDIGARFTFTTEAGVTYEQFRIGVTELLRIADEYTPTLDGYMRKDQTSGGSGSSRPTSPR